MTSFIGMIFDESTFVIIHLSINQQEITNIYTLLWQKCNRCWKKRACLRFVDSPNNRYIVFNGKVLRNSEKTKSLKFKICH